MSDSNKISSPSLPLIVFLLLGCGLALGYALAERKITSITSEEEIECVAFSPDGKRIVSGCDGPDGEIKVWDVGSGEEILTLKGHKYSVKSVAFSPDGKRIFSEDGADLKMWDVETGREQFTLAHEIKNVAVSPDGKRLACIRSVDNKFLDEVQVWDVNARRELFAIQGYRGSPRHDTKVVFSADGKRLVAGSFEHDDTVKLWDASSGKGIQSLKGHVSTVESVACSPDGKWIVSHAWEEIKVWDAATGAETLTIRVPPGEIECIGISPNGQRIIVGGERFSAAKNGQAVSGGTVKVWNRATGEEELFLKGHTSRVRNVMFSPDGKRIVSGSWGRTNPKHFGNGGEVIVWDAVTGKQLQHFQRSSGSHSHGLAISPDGTRIASGGFDEVVKVWHVNGGADLLKLKRELDLGNEVRCVAFSPDRKWLAAGGSLGGVKVWNVVTGKVRLSLKHTTLHEIDSVAFSPDSKRIVSASCQFEGSVEVKVWDATSGDEMLAIEKHRHTFETLALSPDGKRVAAARNWDRPFDLNELKIWDISTAAELLTIKGFRERITGLAFSPDGKRMLTVDSGYNLGELKLWDAATGREILNFRGHTLTVVSAAFSPDGKRIVSGSYRAHPESDKGWAEIKVWNAHSGDEALTLKGPSCSNFQVAFSPDGNRIAIGGHGWDQIKDRPFGKIEVRDLGDLELAQFLSLQPQFRTRFLGVVILSLLLALFAVKFALGQTANDRLAQRIARGGLWGLFWVGALSGLTAGVDYVVASESVIKSFQRIWLIILILSVSYLASYGLGIVMAGYLSQTRQNNAGKT